MCQGKWRSRSSKAQPAEAYRRSSPGDNPPVMGAAFLPRPGISGRGEFQKELCQASSLGDLVGELREPLAAAPGVVIRDCGHDVGGDEIVV